jgi:uncharacterized cupredoxin-like copper-binding protein
MRYVLSARMLALVALPLIAAACGGDSKDTVTPDSGGVVEVTMRDTRYEPDRIQVEVGDTVTFRFKNAGAIAHEAFIGDEAAQEAHEMEMSASTMSASTMSASTMTASTMTASTMTGSTMPTEHDTAMAPESGADDPASPLRLEPGETGTLDYTFQEPGTILIGCHEPGHWAGGMRAEINVG